jgi:hypothetical protein
MLLCGEYSVDVEKSKKSSYAILFQANREGDTCFLKICIIYKRYDVREADKTKS